QAARRSERVCDSRRGDDRAAPTGAVRRVSQHRGRVATRGRCEGVRSGRARLREQRRRRPRSRAAAARGRRSRGRPRRWGVPRGGGIQLQSPADAARSARRRGRLASGPPPADRTRHAGAGAVMAGALIAFEGLDQSGKQTQAERLRDRVKAGGRKARVGAFPDHPAAVREEVARGPAGGREYDAGVLPLRHVANRYERKPDLTRWLDGGLVLVCDRYVASSIAYGEAFGLDPAWLAEIQRFLPTPALTIFLDIAPETAAARKTVDRDRYERDL